MKFIELRCKNCKAKLVVDEDNKEATCNYCGTVFKIDDEVKHIKYDDMEQSGYDFEKGRIRAQEEYNNDKNKSIKSITVEPKKKRSIFFYFLCFMFFPIALTYFIAKSDKIDKRFKGVLIVLVWLAFMFLSAMSDYEEDKLKKEKIIECYNLETYEKLDELLGIDNVFGTIYEDSSCDVINLRYNGEKLEIIIDDNTLISIKNGDEYIYSIDKITNDEEENNVNQE